MVRNIRKNRHVQRKKKKEVPYRLLDNCACLPGRVHVEENKMKQTKQKQNENKNVMPEKASSCPRLERKICIDMGNMEINFERLLQRSHAMSRYS